MFLLSTQASSCSHHHVQEPGGSDPETRPSSGSLQSWLHLSQLLPLWSGSGEPSHLTPSQPPGQNPPVTGPTVHRELSSQGFQPWTDPQGGLGGPEPADRRSGEGSSAPNLPPSGDEPDTTAGLPQVCTETRCLPRRLAAGLLQPHYINQTIHYCY